MKRRLLYTFAALAVAAVLVSQFKGKVVAWYVDNHTVRTTALPSSGQPDQVCLTWSGDPRATQTIEWRTAPAVPDGWVQYREKADANNTPAEAEATLTSVNDRLLQNDQLIHRFTSVLHGLKPATAYQYRAGSKQQDHWSDWAEFTTAPDKPVGFSFVYMGDPQIGLDSWGKLMQAAEQRCPTAAFYAIAGDQVDNGNRRDQWDDFFDAARGVLDRHPLVPCLGNHDYGKRLAPEMYLQLLTLPENGPKTLPAEHAYSFRFAGALFVVLDSNQALKEQTPWLEEQLAQPGPTWKFVMYHHPAYSSKGTRDNEELRQLWTPLFDKYHVDVALQGHDHAYLRTYPMKEGKRAQSAKDGVYYIVSVSGTKYYEQTQHDYAEIAFTKTSTYQIFDVTTDPNRLTYRAYDVQGNVKDEFTIDKQG
ncbi:MAG: metallophosphoesterase family protein [Candidatus Hydrogenedentes bacterium]|nr:metallophosphoesterase family protein [Candidatus Hydrogenedentota bacterium]